MPQLHQIIPNADDLLALESEEVAPLLLQVICSEGGGPTARQSLKCGNFFLSSTSPANGYAANAREKIYELLAAAWVWLEREGMLLPAPGQQRPRLGICK